MLSTLKPATQTEEKEEEVSEKEFEENWRYRCYRRCRYYRLGHRVYRRCYRKCYRYMENNKLQMSDAEFFKSSVEQAEGAVAKANEDTEITEKEFEENRYYRCYRRCRYYRYHHRYYRRCYRRCYRYLEGEKELTDA